MLMLLQKSMVTLHQVENNNTVTNTCKIHGFFICILHTLYKQYVSKLGNWKTCNKD